jgi:lipid-A-disaccharide synthase
MRLFVSAGEPSGDLHGANLIASLRRQQPGLQFNGFGGERMAAAGCSLLYPLCDLALVGLVRVLVNVPRFRGILKLADRFFSEQRPDALVLIDYPGFHWWLARCARKHGVPVLYFIPPQLWAWGSWRVGKMRRLVDRVLCTLPFEEEWYRRHNVSAHYIGHPYFDELRSQHLDSSFLGEQQSRPGTIVAILPGSRSQELQFNLSSQLRAAGLIHARRPDVRFLVACLHSRHARQVAKEAARLSLPIEVHAGRTPEILQLAHSCLAVSGSISLEMLYRTKPAVVIYRHHWVGVALGHLLKRCKYISLPNLLADETLYPEYFGTRCEAEAMADHVLHWLNDHGAYEELCGRLGRLCARVSQAGACDRAAASVLELLHEATGSPKPQSPNHGDRLLVSRSA